MIPSTDKSKKQKYKLKLLLWDPGPVVPALTKETKVGRLLESRRPGWATWRNLS
jgi:hypothetical protein